MSKFPSSTILFTDTDSLCYAVDDADLTSRMGEISNEFDFSEYQVTHPLYSPTNMKIIVKFKDELHACTMTKFVGLRPKLYSYAYVDTDGVKVESNTSKGVKKRVKNAGHMGQLEKLGTD